MSRREAPVHPEAVRPLAGLAAWVVPLVVATIAVSGMAAVNQLHKLSLDGRLLKDALKVSASDVTQTYHRQVVLNRWFTASFIAGGVVFLIWLYRAASNARAVGRFSDSPGLAVGGWFIPFANLVLPVVAVFRVMRASRPEPHRLLIGTWWAMYVVGSGVGLVGASVGRSGASLADIHRADALWVWSEMARIVAGVLLVIIVRLITAGQQAWAEDQERSNQERLFEYSAGAASG